MIFFLMKTIAKLQNIVRIRQNREKNFVVFVLVSGLDSNKLSCQCFQGGKTKQKLNTFEASSGPLTTYDNVYLGV